MAKSRKTQPEEDSFYDAFLAPTEAPTASATTNGAAAVAAPASLETEAAKGETLTTPEVTTALPEEAPTEEVELPARVRPRGRPANNGKGGGKRNDPDYMQASAYLPRELRREIDLFLLYDSAKRDYSQLLKELLERFLAEQKESA